MRYSISTFFLFFCLISQAQNYEKYMYEVKSLASVQKYHSADSLIEVALRSFPNDHDLLCYKARLSSWQGELTKADVIIDQVLLNYPEDLEAFKIKATLSYWSGKHEKLLIQAQEYLSIYPDEPDFRFYEAFAYYQLGMTEKSTTLIEELLVSHPDHRLSIRLQKDIKSNQYQFIEAELTYSHFNSILDPWQQIRLGYGVNKKMPWNAHLVAAKRFGTDGLSIEAEAYPRLARQTYAFVEASYSPSSFMADYTAGLEVFQRLYNFEVSIGSKRFKFDQNAFFLHKASLGFYKKKYFARYQILLSNALSTHNYTHILRLRTYLRANHYLEGELVSGTNVQEYLNPEGTTTILENRSAGLRYSAQLTEKTSLLFGIRMRTEEYRPQMSRIRMDFQMSFKVKLH